MPELPEVETVRRGLESLIIHKKIQTVAHDTPKSFPNATKDINHFLIGASIIAVRRRAKVLLIDLSSDYSLVIHLKMTGQLVFVGKTRFGAGHPNDSLINALPDKSTRVEVAFDDNSKLFFNDQRKFGWVKLVPTLEIPNINFMKKVGPEPLEADFTKKEFRERFTRRSRTSIKSAILDQTVIAGVGNIYADESLWGARIHPKRLVSSITIKEFDQLYTELRGVMSLAIEKGGSSNHTYINAEGNRGSYMNFARVFRRDGKMCPRHSDIVIEKIRVAGRGTHICPVCQVE
jgi:formamidopyrimidine-DNA glycosylase